MKRRYSITTTESNNNNVLDSQVQNSAIPPTENLQVTNYFKCNFCKQTLEEIVFYNGHPNNSCEEFIALTNERLIIFTGEEQDLHERDSRPVHKLTGYSVYDEQGHLCPFDNDLVEQNVVLRLSGFMKPVYAEDPSIDDGIPTHDIGPINAWYITGFDGGEKAYVGILTTYAEYILMDPSPEYLAFVKLFFKKVPLLKVIIEFLLDHGWENPTYEDLLDHLQNTNSEFTEDFVLQNSHFVCKQVYSFERAAPDEEPLMGVSCMKTLINLSGVTLDRVKRNQSQKRISSKLTDRKATTTQLVRSVFENFFPHQIENKDEKLLKKRRCGICDACQSPDCGKCVDCRSMLKFGGAGKNKQACKFRRCPNMELQESDDSDNDDDNETSNQSGADNMKKLFSFKQTMKQVEWPNLPVAVEAEKRYFDVAVVGGITVAPGDFVMLNPDAPNKPLIIGKIISLFSKHSQPTFHVQMYCRGTNTILGETADPQELFLVDVCEDCPLGSIVSRADVTFKKVPKDWSILGGIQTLHKSDNKFTFFFNKRYENETARFTHYVEEDTKSGVCPCCKKRSEIKKFETKIFEENSVQWRGELYEIGSSVFLKPCTYKFHSTRLKRNEADNRPVSVDDEVYPEYYRKIFDVKNPAEEITQPFCVGQIEDVYTIQKSDEIKIKVRIFYRPENTKNSVFLAHEKDLNLVYWTEEVITTSFNNVVGKCYLSFFDTYELSEWSEKGPHRFYFVEGYDPKTYDYFDVPRHASRVAKGKGKGKIKSNEEFRATEEPTPPEWETLGRPLKCMDVFAGCGGLSLGLHQSGVAETKWAIENMTKPAEAFKVNNRNCRVFTEDCNKILKEIISETGGIKELPGKGEVEILVGGPPCQGFSNMNRFSARQYSLLKNSLIATFLSFCDYYRPKYFVLENVRNFASFKRSMVLKLTLRCLLALDYQVAFGILQAAHYGLPQTRRRFILIAAAPGCALPNFPEPQSVFEKRDYHLSLTVDGIKYHKSSVRTESAPYRAACVRDAISDLPTIINGSNKEKMPYDGEAISHFQRKMRRSNNEILFDHVCKEMAPIVEARISYIPGVPGSDWRDLPNICVRLRDDTVTNKLQYQYYSRKQKKFDKPRAICACITGKSCNPSDRQVNTLIPWCLPHTADRHNNWGGLYGRLGWDEVFKTTITNPEPMGKQGKVIHPEQHRVVSVRECARSQGFPDHFRFVGNVMDKHRQIGNAVPPPLGKAIGLEIRTAMASMKTTNPNC